MYHIAGNICGVQFLWMVDLLHFAGLISWTSALTPIKYTRFHLGVAIRIPLPPWKLAAALLESSHQPYTCKHM